MTEHNAEDDRDVDNIATLEKETGINKDVILNNIGKSHPIGPVENGKQLRIVKFRSDNFEKVICKKYKQLLREKCPNTEFFLVRIFLYSDWIQENAD